MESIPRGRQIATSDLLVLFHEASGDVKKLTGVKFEADSSKEVQRVRS